MRRFWPLLLFPAVLVSAVCHVQAQGARQKIADTAIHDSDKDHIKQRNEWFYRGRIVRGKSSAELRGRAYQRKLQMRGSHAAARMTFGPNSTPLGSGSWRPLGPVPLDSDASGNGTQDYGHVAGRVTAVAIDPADPTGNTVYLGGAQGGVWKSTNAAYAVANNVAWIPVTDNQATLSIGSIAIQPGNSDPSKSVILAATGEANNSGDSYFGLGILRSTDAGNTWNLVSTANEGVLSFSGLGGTRMAFRTANAQTTTVVAAMAASSEGLIDGAVTASTKRGLYTSVNAGQTWIYNALADPGGATDSTSATAVAYNAAANSGAGLFFAAVRYHGFYSSPDGSHWTRLGAQPGGAVLSTTACPPQSTSNDRTCPIYRGEISVVPGRNEMYAWYVFLDAFGTPQDGGIWQSLNGGGSWTAISDAGITNCGDIEGCGVEQGTYNLELLAVPNGSATDLYAGAVNIFKCAINSANPNCTSAPFINLTHVYGCVPAGAPAHVHPDQHALAAMIPALGTDSGNELLYFANDGGLYRALNGFSGLNSGACSGSNQFDDLNQNLGSLAQFVSFSQHPTDADTLLGGTQDNGSPATHQATLNTAWLNVLGGDGGYNAIDPIVTSNWYASNPDLPPGGLGIQVCTGGINCNNSSFNFVVTSNNVDGDDGGFYFPYILDPGSTSAMLVGTCRIWRGSRTGGVFTALSPNFDTWGSGTCTGGEVNQVRALAAAGPTRSSSGSNVVYATTSGLGPVEGPLSFPAGGRVWVTADTSTGIYGFIDVTENGPEGTINANQFPISSVFADTSDATGNTAYVTVMGFTGGSGHVWKTTNAGTTWTDFTGNLPDSPVNAVVVYPPLGQVYVGTDIGVFASSTSSPDWTELGPNPSTNSAGFLPNVAVTALGIFASGGQQLLRASTYGRGVWEFNLVITPDFEMSLANTPLTTFAGRTATLNGTVTARNGYATSVALSCVAGSTSPPSVCSPSPLTLTPTTKTPFSVSMSGNVGDYLFNIQGAGSDANHLTHRAAVTVHVVNFGLTTPSPSTVNAPRGTTSAPVSFQITAAGSFDQPVTVSCSTTITNATCNLTPGTTVNPDSTTPVNMTARIVVPLTTAVGTYSVTLRAATDGAPSALTASFDVRVTANPDFVLNESSPFPQMNVGSTGASGPISISSQDGFAGTVTLSCAATYGAGSCSLSPASVSSFPATASLSINARSFTAGTYTLSITGTSGSVSHTLPVAFNIGDYSIVAPASLTGNPGTQAVGTINLQSNFGYSGSVNATCDASAIAAAICTFSSANPIAIASGGSTDVRVTLNVPNDAAGGSYSIRINTQDKNGAPVHSAEIPLTVGDYSLSGPATLSTVPAGEASASLKLSSLYSYSGSINSTCDVSAFPHAICALSPATAISLASGGTANLTATVNVPTDANPGTYNIKIKSLDTRGTPSHSLTIAVAVAQDFVLTSSTRSQTVKAGQSTGAYNLTIQPVGSSFDSLVTLACPQGLPSGAQCNFSPSAPVTPGTSAVNVVMSIATSANGAALKSREGRSWMVYATWFFLPALAMISGSVRNRSQKLRRLFFAITALPFLLCLASCSGVSSAGNGGTSPPPNSGITYLVTVSGSSPGTPPTAGHSAIVTLIVD
jgi:hypothetical protein